MSSNKIKMLARFFQLEADCSYQVARSKVKAKLDELVPVVGFKAAVDQVAVMKPEQLGLRRGSPTSEEQA